MKPGDLVMTKRSEEGEERAAALVLDDGSTVAIKEGTPALVLDIDIDPRGYLTPARVLINGTVGILWPHELEEVDETR
jgi:short subunit dehydrogenase-like uncharacterized protein